MNVVTRILRYLKSSPRKDLMFGKNNHSKIEGYTDADWARNITDRKSTSWYFTLLVETSLLGGARKKKVVALSSAKVEFRGMAKGLCELLWLRNLLN